MVHAHVWQAAAVPMLFWEKYKSTLGSARPVRSITFEALSSSFTVLKPKAQQPHCLFIFVPRAMLTIHNMDNSGECRVDEFAATSVSGDAFMHIDRALDERTWSQPRAAVPAQGRPGVCQRLTTVSPNYANETLNGGKDRRTDLIPGCASE